MSYSIVTIKPEMERRAQIAELVASSNEKFSFYGLNKEMSLTVVLVPSSLPVYRMNNGRTRSEQLEIVADEGLDAKYFSTGQENREAQQRQHDILADFAREGRENSVEPIIDVLAAQGQREPIVIAPTGVVLNGNRRLSAIRELYDSDPKAYANFANVQVAVLPTMTAEQEFEIEVNLQMTPQTLLEYSWVNESLVVEEALIHGRTASQVAALQRQSPQWVNSTVAALSEARKYLEWKKQPHGYRLVKNKKQFFWDLAKLIKDKPALEAEAARLNAWMLDSSEERSGRVYSYNPIIGGDPMEIIDQIDTALGGLVPAGNEGGEFELELGADDRGAKLQAFIDAANDESLLETIQSAVVDAAEDALDKQKNKARADKPLKIIKSARSNLDSLEVHLVPVDDLPQVVSQLSELIIKATSLRSAAQVRLDVSLEKD